MTGPRTIVPPSSFVVHGVNLVAGVAPPSLANHGGSVLGSVEVVCIYWGADWGNGNDATLRGQLDGFFDFIVTSQYLDMLAEYSTGTTAIGHGRRVQSVTVTGSEPGTVTAGVREVTDGQIQTALAGWIGEGTVTGITANTLYFVFLPPNVSSSMSNGGKSCTEYCGYHNANGSTYYAVIPYVTCAGCTFSGGTLDTLTEIISHELAEAITDPGLNAWYDSATGNEIGDICNRQTVRLGNYLVQTEWSNAQGVCTILPATAWRQFELADGGAAAGSAPVAAVSRIPGSMEMWWVGGDGSVHDAYWYDNTTWQQFILAGAGSASTNGGITATSRVPGSMEVWWIGPDGAVHDAYWYDNATWQQFILAGAGSAATSGGITSVARIPTSMEVWWIGGDGSVQGAYWYEGNNWGRYQLAGPGSASTSSGIKAVSRIPGSMELWWVGPDGSVHDAYWYEGGNWQQFVLAGPGSASTSSGIAAVSRIPGSMEVWWTGPDGAVHDAYWYDGGNWQQFILAGPGSASTNGGIAAVSRIPGSMEVWWVGADGSIQDAYWYDTGTWQRFTLAQSGSAATDGGIAAVARIPGSMELWWVGAGGALVDNYWYG